MHHHPYRLIFRFKNLAIALLFLMLFLSAAAQKKYTPTDTKGIQKNSAAALKAMQEWDRKKLYQLGVYFEGIYDKYKDTSMKMAIACYNVAASSESEYGFNKECYSAAARLAKIYETGKGAPIQLQKAMIYYYLSDQKHTSNYNSLGIPAHNAGFQRIRKNYCSRDIVSVFKTATKIDSIIFEFSPFCNLQGTRLNNALKELSVYLSQNPGKRIDVTIAGGPSIPAAQYTLKVENFILPAIYTKCVSVMVDQGVSNERAMPMKRDSFESDEYKMVLRVIQ